MLSAYSDTETIRVLRRAGIDPRQSVVLRTAGIYLPGTRTISDAEIQAALEIGLAAEAEDYHDGGA